MFAPCAPTERGNKLAGGAIDIWLLWSQVVTRIGKNSTPEELLKSLHLNLAQARVLG
jgi:hypothetical protein